MAIVTEGRPIRFLRLRPRGEVEPPREPVAIPPGVLPAAGGLAAILALGIAVWWLRRRFRRP